MIFFWAAHQSEILWVIDYVVAQQNFPIAFSGRKIKSIIFIRKFLTTNLKNILFYKIFYLLKLFTLLTQYVYQINFPAILLKLKSQGL